MPNCVKDPWIQTISGKRFHFLNPQPEDIDIFDIAHALSLVNRFGGHTPKPYSVAQHSVLISQHVSNLTLYETVDLRLLSLLDDAAESYICDLCSPLKHCGLFDSYREIEGNIKSVIFRTLGLEDHEEDGRMIKETDHRMLATEMRDLFTVRLPELDDFIAKHKPFENLKIIPWHPELARHCFLKTYFDLQDIKHEVASKV